MPVNGRNETCATDPPLITSQGENLSLSRRCFGRPQGFMIRPGWEGMGRVGDHQASLPTQICSFAIY